MSMSRADTDELKYLPLRPLAPAVQRVAVYETKLVRTVVYSKLPGNKS